MQMQRPTSDWRVAGAFADTNTKFKKNTINVIDEGWRVGQQSTKTLTTRSSTKTQINKNTVSVISGDKQSTDALPTLCRRVPQHKRHIRITATMKCKQVTTDASTDMLTASHLFAPQVTMVCVCIYIYTYKRLADYQLKLFVSELSHLSKSLVHVRQRKVRNVNILTWYQNSTLTNIDRAS